MLSNAYLLAKIRFDTAENEPAKNLQNFANFPHSANFANLGDLGLEGLHRFLDEGELPLRLLLEGRALLLYAPHPLGLDLN